MLSAVAKVFSESANRGHDEQFFTRAMAPYNLPEIVREVLCSVYVENQKSIYEHTPDRVSSARSYRDLSWRLNVELSRRSLKDISVPHYEVSISTASRTGDETISFVAGGTEMKKLQDGIELALKEERGVHSQRFQRYLN